MIKSITKLLNDCPIILKGKFYELAGVQPQEFQLWGLRLEQGKTLLPERILTLQQAINHYHNIMIDLQTGELNDGDRVLLNGKKLLTYGPADFEAWRKELDNIDGLIGAYIDGLKAPIAAVAEQITESITKKPNMEKVSIQAKLAAAPALKEKRADAFQTKMQNASEPSDRKRLFLNTRKEDLIRAD